MTIVLVLSLFSGINLALGVLSLFICRNNKAQKHYLYFGIFSLFSGFYFLLIALSSNFQMNIKFAIIFCAAVYYGVFPWLIFELINKKKKTYAIILTSVFALAFLVLVFDKTERVFPFWQIIAHIGLIGLMVTVIYAAIIYYKDKLKGANVFLTLTILFIFLSLEEIITNYTGIVILKNYISIGAPLDIYPLLFSISVSIRLTIDFYSKNKMRVKILENDLKKKELQLIEIERKRLVETLDYKTKDLTNFGIEITKNREFMQNLYTELHKIKDSNKNDPNNLNAILKRLKSRLIINKELNYFNGNVKKINHEFTIKLKTMYPSLTPKEIHLASLLRLNLNTKEIANIKNVESNSVKVLRYRLRQKLNLETTTNLSEFLNNIN